MATDKIDKLRAIVVNHQNAKVDGVTIDATTARAIITIYDALNEDTRAKYAAMDIGKMARVAWKLVSAR